MRREGKNVGLYLQKIKLRHDEGILIVMVRNNIKISALYMVVGLIQQH
jgi:hypothetical protein